ncbi:hypothetical protein N7491_006162 [Penicillium cf. griseofulvum]|nr:hypothetical protein N7491_006162 [Penicillium cf. griseofulvum]KAJ5437061.1 hypothetical protein N7445_007946 [Penicillium cf. griseofulvum]
MSSEFHPSVYKSTSGQYFAEPAGDRSDYYWITVHFPEDDDHLGLRDSEIMVYVKNMIVKGHFTIDDRAMHGLGKKCLSTPIKRDPDIPLPKSYTADPTHPDLLLAANLAAYWKDQIYFQKVTLDQQIIFAQARRKLCKTWLGEYVCLIPKVKTPEQDLDTLMFQVEDAALWYVRFICAETITIDKEMLFLSRQPPSDRESQLLIEPLYWDKPDHAIANPWSTATKLRD